MSSRWEIEGREVFLNQDDRAQWMVPVEFSLADVNSAVERLQRALESLDGGRKWVKRKFAAPEGMCIAHANTTAGDGCWAAWTLASIALDKVAKTAGYRDASQLNDSAQTDFAEIEYRVGRAMRWLRELRVPYVTRVKFGGMWRDAQ